MPKLPAEIEEILETIICQYHAHPDGEPIEKRVDRAKAALTLRENQIAIRELQKLKKEHGIDIDSYGAIACDYLAKTIDERIGALKEKQNG